MEPYTEYRKADLLNPRNLYCATCRNMTGHFTTPMLPKVGVNDVKFLTARYPHWENAVNILEAYKQTPAENVGMSDIIRHKCMICGTNTYDYIDQNAEDWQKKIHPSNVRYNLYRLYPFQLPPDIPLPNDDMSETCRQYYEEAAQVFPYSPRAAAALIRLGLQTFLQELGIPGNRINAQIAHLAGQGLAEELRQGLDYCRVVGNEAVHPGTIDLNDNRDMAMFLFVCFNMLVSELVTKKKQMKTFHDMLPAHLRAAADKRDGRNPTPPANE